MSATERFAQRLTALPGVEQFVLTRDDGRILTHNLSAPQELASLVTLCGINGQALPAAVGFTSFRHIICACRGQQDLIIFPLERYFLGIRKRADANRGELIEAVNRFLQRLSISPRGGDKNQ